MKKELNHYIYQVSIQDLVNRYNNSQLNLEPDFQRDSVWTAKDRKKLIESLIKNYPLPAIFLYKREEKGKIIYDVIDGKQRLETVFFFMGVIRGKRFSLKAELDDNPEETIEIDWNYLNKKGLKTLITDYKVYTIEVDGTLSDIIELFVRINSTGKALTTAEKQHAKYFKSRFLKTASYIAQRNEDYFISNGILSFGQISRMKHIELICEIMISIGQKDVINKKSAIDRIMDKGLKSSQLSKLKIKTIKALNRVGTMFPNLFETRFIQLSDFYVLVVLISNYEDEGLILTDKKRNKLAFDLLVNFSNGVDIVREKQKKLKNIEESEGSYSEYLLTVLSSTDDISQRRNRLKILDGILRNLFAVKDKQRGFSQEQRRLIWNSTEERICTVCGEKLTWDDFTIDHIDPHSRGGRSIIENASLMCRRDNSSKGNRR